MLKTIGAAALVGSLALPCLSTASEVDWLYFQMYERDTAHAVDLKALRFRSDGLLASGTRYPRVDIQPWTAEVSERGWHDYVARLIDCETGLFVDTAAKLLDRDGKTIASYIYSRDEQLERLTGRLRSVGTQPWPDNSETLLACAAASSPTLRAARARKARAPLPLISAAPITKDLQADSDTLMALTRKRFDLDAIAKRTSTTARAVFEQLQVQDQQWRRSIAGPAVPAPGLPPARLAAVQAQLDTLLQRKRANAVGGIRLLARGAVEYESEATVRLDALPPAQMAKTADVRVVTETVLADCNSGVRVPLARHWRGHAHEVLLTQPVPPKVALAVVRLQLEDREPSDGWDMRRGAERDGSRAGAICRLMARLAMGLPTNEADAEPMEIDLTEPFGVKAEQLARETTPEGLLLRLRAAARAQRP